MAYLYLETMSNIEKAFTTEAQKIVNPIGQQKIKVMTRAGYELLNRQLQNILDDTVLDYCDVPVKPYVFIDRPESIPLSLTIRVVWSVN